MDERERQRRREIGLPGGQDNAEAAVFDRQADDPVAPVSPDASPDMKIDPGGHVDNDGREIGPVDGTAHGLGGAGGSTAGGGLGPSMESGTVPGRTSEGRRSAV